MPDYAMGGVFCDILFRLVVPKNLIVRVLQGLISVGTGVDETDRSITSVFQFLRCHQIFPLVRPIGVR